MIIIIIYGKTAKLEWVCTLFLVQFHAKVQIHAKFNRLGMRLRYIYEI